MSCTVVHLGIGTRAAFDGEIFAITELLPTTTGTEVILTGATAVHRMTLVALLPDDRAKLLVDKTSPTTGARK
jgi:hypothetical protein